MKNKTKKKTKAKGFTIASINTKMQELFMKEMDYACGEYLREDIDEFIQSVVHDSLYTGKLKETIVKKVQDTLLKSPEVVAQLTAKAILRVK